MFLRYTKLFNHNIRDAVDLHKIDPMKAILKYGKIEDFDTTNVTDFSGLFQKFYYDVDLSQWNVSNATTTFAMFRGFKHFTGKIDGWKLQNNKNASHMFNGCIYLEELPYDFVMDNVRNGSYMFSNCFSLKGHSLVNCHTNNLRNAAYMFNECINLQYILYWNIDELKVTNHMFYKCYSMHEKYDVGKRTNTYKQNNKHIISSYFGDTGIAITDNYLYNYLNRVKNDENQFINILGNKYDGELSEDKYNGDEHLLYIKYNKSNKQY